MSPGTDVDKLTLRQMFEGMVQAFDVEKAKGWDTVIQYNITGEGGGKFYMVIKDSKCTLGEGESPDTKATITVSRADWYSLAKGELDGAEAFMTGRISATGNTNDLLRMQFAFKQST